MGIRLTQPSDVDGAIATWQAANIARGKPPTVERIARVREKLTDVGSSTYVSVAENGRIVGMVLVEPGRDGDGLGAMMPGWLHVSMCFVRPEAQRHGVGSSLVRHMLDAARDGGMVGVSLWTSTENIGAKRLYERAGMNPTRVRQVGQEMAWVLYEVRL